MAGIQAPYAGVWYGALSAGSNAVPRLICHSISRPDSRPTEPVNTPIRGPLNEVPRLLARSFTRSHATTG